MKISEQMSSKAASRTRAARVTLRSPKRKLSSSKDALSRSTTVSPRRRVRRHRGGQERDETLPSGVPVAQLAAVLARDDGQHAVDEPGPQPGQRALAQVRRQCRRVRDVKGELDPRVGRVDALPTRTGRPGEPPRQLVLRRSVRAGHSAP